VNINYQNIDITNNDGILLLALKDVFQRMQDDKLKTYMLLCEYVEIYNDKIYDLLGGIEKLD